MKDRFSIFPLLETDRLSLRQITVKDGPTIFFLRTDKVVNEFIHRPNPHKNVAEAEAFIEMITSGMENGENVNWGIRLKGEAELVGSICLWNFSTDGKTAEVGYDLHPKFQNRRIMSEALKIVLKYGFESLNLNKIEAYTQSENENSKRLLLRCGFTLNETRKDPSNPLNSIFELQNRI